MKTTNHSTVELVDSMGSDLTVVNAARVSFDKESNWEDCQGYCLNERDKKLIHYLAKHNHWSPFAHTSIQLRINAPIFVARQLVKHQVGGVWNEISRRYVDDEPVFFFPEKWRKRAENVKQGSSNESALSEAAHDTISLVERAVNYYNQMIVDGVAPEQARMILPQNMMTTWYWTGSLIFFNRVYTQRKDNHAQLETQEVAIQIGDICSRLFPVSWNSLRN